MRAEQLDGVVQPQLGDLGLEPGLLDAGDVAVAPGRLFVGVPRAGGGFRAHSNAHGRAQLGALAGAMGYRTVELPVAHDILRLRNAFSIVGSETAVAAYDKVDVAAADGMQIVALPRGEDLAAGVLAYGERRVIANLRFRESIALLRKAKIGVESIDLWEFGKAGYGPFALVLAIKRT
ncbi:MAG: hypothetical protein NVS9B10_31190 [Nevskia sp.]